MRFVCVMCRLGGLCDDFVQDDDEVEQQEEQRRVDRKSKREEDANDDDDDEGDEGDASDDDGQERVGGGKARDGLADSDKAKKQEAKNAKQKVVSFCVAALVLGSPPLPHQANRKEKKKIKLRASSRAGAEGEDVVEDLEFSD